MYNVNCNNYNNQEKQEVLDQSCYKDMTNILHDATANTQIRLNV